MIAILKVAVDLHFTRSYRSSGEKMEQTIKRRAIKEIYAGKFKKEATVARFLDSLDRLEIFSRLSMIDEPTGDR